MQVKPVDYADIYNRVELPARVIGMINKPNSILVGAYEENMLVGIAVVIVTEGQVKYTISYLAAYAAYEADKDEIILNILMYVEEMCIQAGENFVAVRLIAEAYELYDFDSILIDCGYSVVSRDGKYMMYYFQKIKETAFANSVCQNEAVKKYVYAQNEVDESLLKPFREKQREHERDVLDDPDLVFGRYYVVDGVIRGYVDVREIADGILVLKDAFVEKHPSTKMALVHMLAVMVNTSLAFLPEDAVLYLYYQSEILREIFLKVFGEAEIDNVVYEYGKVL